MAAAGSGEHPRDLACGVAARNSGDAAGMRTGPAVVQAGQRTAIVREAEQRPRMEQRVQRQRPVEDVAVDEVEAGLEGGG